MNRTYQTIEAMPLGPAPGAEITGIDIARGIGDEQFAELRQAFVDYGVFTRSTITTASAA